MNFCLPVLAVHGTDVAVLQAPCGGITSFAYNGTARDLITVYAEPGCVGLNAQGDIYTSACPITPPKGVQAFLLLYDGLNDIVQSFRYGPLGYCPYVDR